MALPRRCKKCRCYVAPQLSACPRCGKSAPKMVTVVRPTKAEKRAAMAEQDATVKSIQAKHIHWIPSTYSLETQSRMAEELKRRLAKAPTARERNTIRSELRLVKAHLARADVPDGKRGWTSEQHHTKTGCFVVFIDHKGRKYVIADRDAKPDLIIESRKKLRKAVPYIRLQRLESSKYMRSIRQEERTDKQHAKRAKIKKASRAKRRLSKRAVAQ